MGHHGYEPFHQGDPFPAYATLRAAEPVMYDERIDHWVVTRYEDVKAVFSDWETFSSENAQAPVRQRGREAARIMAEGGFTAYSGLSARIPPDHTRIRRVVAKAFSPRRYKALEPAIRAQVVTLLDTMLARADRTGDLMPDLGMDVPTVTILTLIGADITRVATFKRWSDSRSAMTWGDLSDDEQVPHAHNLVAYWRECLRLVADAHEHERDSLVGDLVRAQRAGDDISDHEIASVCYSMLFAGHETTTTLICNALHVLLTHPDQWKRIVDEPALIPGAVDEILRYSPSIVAWRRRARRDTEIGGTPIPRGANILLVMASANRDEDRFAGGEQLDVQRANAREHLAFGFGIHYCVGALLSKIQARIVLSEIVRLVPGLRLVDADAVRFPDNLSFRGPAALPVTWDA
jgi:cytochrome P450